MNDSPLVAAYALFALPSLTAGSLRKPAPPPSLWFQCDSLVLVLWPPPWPN